MRGPMAEEAEDHGEDVDNTAAAEEAQHAVAEGGDEEQERSSPTPDPVAELAQEMGWAPKEKWKGDPAEWKDAKSFIKASRDINRRQSADVRELRQTLDRMSRASATLVEREIARRSAELTAAFDDAVESGDREGARRATQDLNRLAVEAESLREPPRKPEATAAFEERNGSWLGKHKGATALAVAECERLARDGIMDPEAQLDIAEREVKRRYPELFETQDDGGEREERPARRQPLVSGSQSRSSGNSGGKKTAKDLPPPARAAGLDFVKRGRVGSLEEYAQAYFEEQA